MTINVGDTVNWVNIGGSHNVNGTLLTFPLNPEGFGNSVSGINWSFSHVFTLPGVYNYQCDPHAPGMSGIITVNNAGCPPSFSYTTVDATDALTNDGQITVTVDAPAVGPFDFYLTDMSSTLLQSSLGQSSSTCIFTNISSGNYIVNIWNYECTPVGTNTDTVSVFPAVGGTITYTGFMGYCGSGGANITAYFNGCASTTIGNQFILTDISGTLVDSSVLMSDSISYSGLMSNQYILQITNLDNNCFSVDTFTIDDDALQIYYYFY